MKAMGEEALKNQNPDHKVLTEANYLEQRAGLEGMIEAMIEPHKEAIAQLWQYVTKTEVKVPARDGFEIPILIYRPKTLES